MKKFKFYAECITDVVLIVEAESLEEAEQIADESDGLDWISDGGSDFRINWSMTKQLEDEQG